MPRDFTPYIPNNLPPMPVLETTKPLDIEIGCGVGLHPIKYTQSNQHRQLIAIEHTRDKFEKFQSRHQNHPHLTNLFPVHANGISFISKHIRPASVARYFLLYPNPWPKACHKNRRWAHMPFMQVLHTTLAPCGELTMATNFGWYMEEALAEMTKWGFQIATTTQLRPEDLGSMALNQVYLPRTHFEQKYLERGQVCFHTVFRKVSQQ